MKQELNSSKVYLEQDELDRLFTEVKETVARDIVKQSENKSFSVADLWNIQRRKKERQRKSNLWN